MSAWFLDSELSTYLAYSVCYESSQLLDTIGCNGEWTA